MLEQDGASPLRPIGATASFAGLMSSTQPFQSCTNVYGDSLLGSSVAFCSVAQGSTQLLLVPFLLFTSTHVSLHRSNRPVLASAPGLYLIRKCMYSEAVSSGVDTLRVSGCMPEYHQKQGDVAPGYPKVYLEVPGCTLPDDPVKRSSRRTFSASVRVLPGPRNRGKEHHLVDV